jgi:hypothetical protein
MFIKQAILPGNSFETLVTAYHDPCCLPRYTTSNFDVTGIVIHDRKSVRMILTNDNPPSG